LREEFVEQINQLRKETLGRVKAKQIKGKFVNGPMLFALAASYAEALNQGKIPTIDTAWSYVQQEELQRTFVDTIRRHIDLINEKFKFLPVNESLLTQQLKTCK
jgi:hypothetical protein